MGLSIQSGHTTLANERHMIEGRLVRWLLMCQDRTESHVPELTHEFVSGSERPATVTLASVFQTREAARGGLMAGRLVKAWIEGMVAGQAGQPAGVNPHPRGTELAGHWEDGRRDGARQQAALGEGRPRPPDGRASSELARLGPPGGSLGPLES